MSWGHTFPRGALPLGSGEGQGKKNGESQSRGRTPSSTCRLLHVNAGDPHRSFSPFTHSVWGMVLSAQDTALDETDKIPALGMSVF